jgi:hypothetical protein
VLDDRRERAWRNREIKQRALCSAERLPDSRECVEIVVVARDVLEQRRQLGKSALVDGSPSAHAVPHAGDELLTLHRPASDADDRRTELLAPDEGLQRRKDLFVREVTGDAEHDERIGRGSRHLLRHYTMTLRHARFTETFSGPGRITSLSTGQQLG